MAIVPDSTLSSSYTANKRQRISTTKVASKTSNATTTQSTVVAIAQPIVTIRQTPGAKRPQMKYDPSVPMTKEQTSEWRRIERKKRNRESAAACRKRQRDRIADLEDEVSVWKTKFENALLSLKTIEGNDETTKFQKEVEKKFVIPPPRENTKELRMKSQQQRNGGGRCTTPPNTATSTTASTTTNTVSPYDRPKFIPPIVTSSGDEVAVDDLHFPVLEDSTTIKEFTSDSLMSRVENLQHSLPAEYRKQNCIIPTPRDVDDWFAILDDCHYFDIQ